MKTRHVDLNFIQWRLASTMFVTLIMLASWPTTATATSGLAGLGQGDTDNNTIPLLVASTVAEDSDFTPLGLVLAATSIQIVSQPPNGEAQPNTANTDIEYKPDANYCNTTPLNGFDSFTYRLNDNPGSDTVVDVTVTCINDPPVITAPASQSVNFNESRSLTGISIADVDINEDSSSNTMEVDLSVSHGTIQVTGGGASGSGTNSVALAGTQGVINAALDTVIYTPNLNYFGSDTLVIGADDLGHHGEPGPGNTDSAEIALNIAGPAPQVNNDPDVTVNEDSSVEIDVLANDNPGPGVDWLPSPLSIRKNPSNGGVQILNNNRIRYTPNSDFDQKDSFEYEACNTASKCNKATVSVAVTPRNDPPTIAPINDLTMLEGTRRTVIATVNDIDDDNGSLIVAATSDNQDLLPDVDITVSPGDTDSERRIRLRPVNNRAGSADVTVTVEDGDNASNSTTFRVTVLAPDLEISTVSDGGASVRPVNTVVYTIQYRNDGLGDATGVELEVSVPSNTFFASSGSSSGWSCNDGAPAGTACTYPVGGLAAGDVGNKSFAVTLDSGVSPAVSEVSVSVAIRDDGSNGDDINPDNNTGGDTTPIDRSVLLRASKRDTPLPSDEDNITDAGDTIVYTIILRNDSVTDAEGVTFSDTPDPNSTIVPGSVVTDKGSVVSGNDAGDQSVEIDIDTLAAGESIAIVFHVQINDPLPDNVVDVSNQGTIAGLNFPSVKTDDPDTASISDPTVTPLGPRPVLSALKSDLLANDANGNGVPSPEETLRYEVSITNRGQAPATNVLLEDTPDPATTLIAGTVSATKSSAIITQGNSSSDTGVEVRVPTLDAAETVTITFNVRINSPLTSDAIQIANQGQVKSAELPTIVTDDPDTLQADDPTRTTVAIIPVLRVDKEALITDFNEDGDKGPGDLIDYTITVRNEGTRAENIVLTDSISTVLTLIPSVPGGDLVQASRGEILAGLNPGDDTVEVAISELGGGESAIITFRAEIAEMLPADLLVVENQAVATADGLEPVWSDNPDTLAPNDSTQTPVTAAVILRAPMRDLLPAGGEIEIGDTLTYNPTIENVGNRAATNVRISGRLSNDTELMPNSVRAGTGGIVVSATPEAFEVLFPTLPAGQTRAVILDVIVRSTTNGFVENQFAVTADNMLGSVTTDDQDTDEKGDSNRTWIKNPLLDALFLPIIRTQ